MNEKIVAERLSDGSLIFEKIQNELCGDLCRRADMLSKCWNHIYGWHINGSLPNMTFEHGGHTHVEHKKSFGVGVGGGFCVSIEDSPRYTFKHVLSDDYVLMIFDEKVELWEQHRQHDTGGLVKFQSLSIFSLLELIKYLNIQLRVLMDVDYSLTEELEEKISKYTLRKSI